MHTLHANADEHATFEALINYDGDVSVVVLVLGMENPRKMNQGRTPARLATLTDGQSLMNALVCSSLASHPVEQGILIVLCEKRIADGLHCCLSGASPEGEGRLARRIYTVPLHDGFARLSCLPLAENASGGSDIGTVQN